MKPDCIFCKIVAGKIPAEKVLENKGYIVIKDANPKVPGHLLVIPKKHYNSFLDMPHRKYEDFFQTVKDAIGTFSGDFNLIINNGKTAGQVIEHLHAHILPRKLEDGFKLNC
ncbi:HIT domain-containing protein [Candidatus Pacearchaeota archaeon]|nr:HIT domain-containing protein [Candidatus Pacearchaeota archaeon]